MHNFVIQLLIGLSIALWIWTLMDLLQSKLISIKHKVFCALIISILPILGALLYFQYKKDNKISDYEVD
ncbi:PLDc N-terminal domain-containing protein [Mariniflexile maritimum]|uniref:PLDc N-terminal domain-containing protein n=1 Tax=Mariniflexile maritimum TaxID=2682493 RepID=UPI0012F6B259